MRETRRNKALIGITVPLQGGWLARQLMKLAVRIAGGKPVMITVNNTDHIKAVDGLILGGGTDIFPMRFQTAPKPEYVYDEPRDEMEIAWLKKAEAENLPVLGVCRGAQMMNVLRGGSLHMQVSEAYEDAHYPSDRLVRIFYRKMITIDEGSLLSRLLQRHETTVNSMHKQSIYRLGENLNITAKERNGVVQAIEDPSRAYFLGVQFHPEFLIYRASVRRIFRKLVELAAEKRR